MQDRAEETKYETCEIVRRIIKPAKWTQFEGFEFVAEVISPNGKYDARGSGRINWNTSFRHELHSNSNRRVVDSMVNDLIKDGWEPVETRGDDWWQYRFRRRVPTKTSGLFNVMLTDFGAHKVRVIQVVRELTGLGLKEAKDLVEATPKAVKEGVNKEEAEGAKAKLEVEGAKAEVRAA